jgi:hypothetical protein
MESNLKYGLSEREMLITNLDIGRITRKHQIRPRFPDETTRGRQKRIPDRTDAMIRHTGSQPHKNPNVSVS